MDTLRVSDVTGWWDTVPLDLMDRGQWESLCDGCGRCCLHKLQNSDTGAVTLTNVACRLLNERTARCSDYRRRKAIVPDCVRLTPQSLPRVDWLPDSCAYRRIEEGRGLPDWHPLVTGDPASGRAAGKTVAGKVISEVRAGPLEDHVVDAI